MSKQLKTFLLYSSLVLILGSLSWLIKDTRFVIPVANILWGLSPAIVAIITTGIFFGKDSIKELLSRIIKKFRLKWLGILIILQLIAYLVGLFIYALVESTPRNFPFSLLVPIPAVFVTCFLSNIWEEIGWRGFLLDKLMTRYSLFLSSWLVGMLWGLWHIPYFMNNIGQNNVSFIVMAIVWMVSSSFIYAYLYERAKRSILAVGIFHALSNTLQSVVMRSELDFTKYFYTLTIAVVLMALFFLIWQRKLFFNVVFQERGQAQRLLNLSSGGRAT